MKTNQYIQVQFTIDDKALAEEIAGKLIEEKLSNNRADCQYLPVAGKNREERRMALPRQN